MGKSKLVEAVQRQATWLAEVLSKEAGKPAPVPYALRVAIVNIIWQLVGGRLAAKLNVATHFLQNDLGLCH